LAAITKSLLSVKSTERVLSFNPQKEEVMEDEKTPLNLPRVELTGSYEIVLASHSAKHAVLVQQSCYGYDGEPSHHFVVRRHGKADFTSDSLFGALAIYNGL